MPKISIYTKVEIKEVITPLLRKIIASQQKGKTLIVGVQGGQGTGKSTIVHYLKHRLRTKGLKVSSFSIDDFYKTAKQRKQLSKKYPNNPFYSISRGLFGTHRIQEMTKTLKKIKDGKPFEIPVFDKSLHNAIGDVSTKTINVKTKQDIVFVEGWCIGLENITSAELKSICKKNKVPLQKMDPKGVHQKIPLKYLQKYQSAWKYLSYLIMLKPDEISSHVEWRYTQEKELLEHTGSGMSKSQIKNFVAPYIPFTYACYEKISPRFIVYVKPNHQFYGLESRLEKKSKIRAVGFDFDGTLIASEGMKDGIMAQVFSEEFGIKRGVKSAYQKLVGKGYNRDAKVTILFKKILKRTPTKKELKIVAAHFGKHYAQSMNSCPLFQCTNIIKELRGQVDFLFMLSLEEKKEVKKIAKHCGVDKYFDEILGGPTSKIKNFNHVIRKHKLKHSEILYIGDAHSDVVASKKKRIKVVLLGEKHTHEKLREDLEADFVFSNLCEVPHSLKKLK
jgi:D-glycerate 3-kinase